MPDVMQQVNELKGLPDQALQFELANPTGVMPAYLVLAEAQRRQLLRSSAQAQQSQQPIGSVYDDVIRSMMARQPPPGQAPAGMTPPPASPPSTPQNAQSPLAMAEGGEVDEYDDGEDYGDDTEDDATVSPIGSASRSKDGVTQMPTKFNLNEAIRQTALRHHRDPAELYGIVMAESHGNPNAVSPKGAIGLGQLMPGTARRFGVDDPTDPMQNLEGSATYLDYLDRKFNKNPTLVHAAYNAGEGAVDKYGGVPPFRETKDYVKLVNQHARQFKGAEIGSGDDPVGPPAKLRPDEMNIVADKAVQSENPPANGIASLEPPNAGLPPAAAPESPFNTVDTFPSIGLPSAPPAAASAAPAVAAQQPQSLEDIYRSINNMRGLPVQQNEREIALQKMIDQMYKEAQARKKPGFWDFVTNFGLGMASTPSRNWAQSIAGGATGMVKGVQAQQEEARKEQLAAMGIDLSLDDKMRAQQQGMIKDATEIAKTQQQAATQAAKGTLNDQIKAFEDLRKTHGAIYGPSDMFDPKTTDFTPTPDPRNAKFSVWSPPSTRKAPKELIPTLNAMGGNPVTGKPFEIGDPVSYDWLEAARKQAGQVFTQQQKHVTTQAELNAAAGIQQTLANHPELPQIMNPDGTPMDPAQIRVNNLPQAIQNEALWRIRIVRDGWTPKNVEGALADKDAPADLKAIASQIHANQATQAGAVTTARTTAAQNAKQALAAKEGAVLNPNGQKVMGETDNVGSTIDQLIDVLKKPQWANNSNPLTLAGSWAKYRMGIGSSEDDELGQILSKLSLTSVQAAMPYARASRNMKWIDMIQQHLPNPPFDSPKNMLQKLLTARRGILGIERSALQWDVKNATTNAPAPALTPDRAQQYLRIAGGDRKKAIQMAQEDGWGPPSMGQ